MPVNASCHFCPTGSTETEFFPTWNHEIDEKSAQFTYNLANAHQKLGFSVIVIHIQITHTW